MIVSSPLLAAIDKAKITINGAVKSNTCVLENSSPSFELPTKGCHFQREIIL